MQRSLLGMAVSLAMAAEAATSTGGSAEAKKVKFCDKEYDLDTQVATFTFGNGKVLNFDLQKVPEATRLQLAMHGASQKIGDSFAGVKGNFGEGVSNAQETIDQLYLGVWKAAREDDARPRLAELAEAIARIKQVPIEAATKAVEAGNDDQRKAWRSNAKVKAIIAQIRAEKAAAALEEAQKSGEKDLEIDIK